MGFQTNILTKPQLWEQRGVKTYIISYSDASQRSYYPNTWSSDFRHFENAARDLIMSMADTQLTSWVDSHAFAVLDEIVAPLLVNSVVALVVVFCPLKKTMAYAGIIRTIW